jgi:hypothetical protein
MIKGVVKTEITPQIYAAVTAAIIFFRKKAGKELMSH